MARRLSQIGTDVAGKAVGGVRWDAESRRGNRSHNVVIAEDEQKYHHVSRPARGRRSVGRALPRGPGTPGDLAADVSGLPPGSAALRRLVCPDAGEGFSPGAVTPTDVREYRGYLLNVEKRQPATVNRRLAGIRRFFQWAKAVGLAKELPTENVKGGLRHPEPRTGWRSATLIG
jgi:integrase